MTAIKALCERLRQWSDDEWTKAMSIPTDEATALRLCDDCASAAAALKAQAKEIGDLRVEILRLRDVLREANP